jgi:uncharacterized membrane protein
VHTVLGVRVPLLIVVALAGTTLLAPFLTWSVPAETGMWPVASETTAADGPVALVVSTRSVRQPPPTPTPGPGDSPTEDTDPGGGADLAPGGEPGDDRDDDRGDDPDGETDGATQAPGPGTGCVGVGCLPRPTAPTPDGSDAVGPDGAGPDAAPSDGAPGDGAPGDGAPGGAEPGSSCGVWDLSACVSGAVNSILRAAVTDALNPALELVTGSLLTTPTLEQVPRIAELWQSSWELLLACYAILVMIAGIVVMAHESVQTRYGLREMLPRLVWGFFAAALSLWAAGLGITVANALSFAVMDGGVDPDTAAAALTDLVVSTVADNGGLVVLLLGLIVVVTLFGLLLVYVVRVCLTLLLIAGAPLALMFHALPQTEYIARWWWRAYFGCLSIQVAQSLTLITAIRVFLDDDGFATTLFGTVPTGAGWINILVALALLYILWRIPFWILGSLRGQQGRSLVGSVIRGALIYRTLGLLGRAGRAATGRGPDGRRPGGGPGGGGPGSGGPGGGPRGGPRPGGPGGSTRTRRRRNGPAGGAPGTPGPGTPGGHAAAGDAAPAATASGQLLLPLEGLRRRPAGQSGSGSGGAGGGGGGGRSGGRGRRGETSAGGRQLALPLTDGLWPEQRAVAGRDGQYRFAFPVPRRPAPRPGGPGGRDGQPASGRGSGETARRGRGGRQLALPLHDPQQALFTGNRPLASGQYPLPLGALPRRPRPAPPRTTSTRPTAGGPAVPSAAPRTTAPQAATSRAATSRAATSRAAASRAAARRTADPYDGLVPLRSGQYPLPIEGLTRQPRTPVATPNPTATPPASTAGPPSRSTRGQSTTGRSTGGPARRRPGGPADLADRSEPRRRTPAAAPPSPPVPTPPDVVPPVVPTSGAAAESGPSPAAAARRPRRRRTT